MHVLSEKSAHKRNVLHYCAPRCYLEAFILFGTYLLYLDMIRARIPWTSVEVPEAVGQQFIFFQTLITKGLKPYTWHARISSPWALSLSASTKHIGA